MRTKKEKRNQRLTEKRQQQIRKRLKGLYLAFYGLCVPAFLALGTICLMHSQQSSRLNNNVSGMALGGLILSILITFAVSVDIHACRNRLK